MKSIFALVAITALITGLSYGTSLAQSADPDAELSAESIEDNQAVDMAVDEDFEVPPEESIGTPEQDHEDLDDEASEMGVDEEGLVDDKLNDEDVLNDADVDPIAEGVDEESAGEGVGAEE